MACPDHAPNWLLFSPLDFGAVAGILAVQMPAGLVATKTGRSRMDSQHCAGHLFRVRVVDWTSRQPVRPGARSLQKSPGECRVDQHTQKENTLMKSPQPALPHGSKGDAQGQSVPSTPVVILQGHRTFPLVTGAHPQTLPSSIKSAQRDTGEG